ncbi:nicotinamide mononucleotide transporter [Nocardia puris]|uniref:nicotinamide riboside transporter PnuC n=1 Tax=Nocardia puris TaxID=208602 RepID=UPI00082A2FC1|nr:nicotinamide riboside transporter PnuC [Nocardia puris]MBF6211273.1 nicotinamide mononucleotide transporter [Nocardia puris]MBF6364992.1 nicotinamide mononucleotide transporter [Nocardia puris]MBF6458777.1 nicotinamide mononucleotide transporter [Nocardia puris]
MNPLTALLDAELHIAGSPILWREIIGNVFGVAAAVGGMRRRVWAWPVGIVGNALLFTVFVGGVFNTPQQLNMAGQAGRQLMFIAVSVFGWYTWYRHARRETGLEHRGVTPRWATTRERWMLVAAMLIGTALFAQLFEVIGSYGPWAEAWIFTGSVLATYGMARGWAEFWLIWIAVDIVGVPLLLAAGYYPSAVLYLVYAGFVLWGFSVWVRTMRGAREVAVGVR